MTTNQAIVSDYLDGFRSTDRRRILACLRDDVEWEIPGFFQIKGKEEFDKHIVDEGFTGNPIITVNRMIEAEDVVVAEGTVRTQRADGTIVNLVFCDLFEMVDAKIQRLTSYLMELK